jgi:integrase
VEWHAAIEAQVRPTTWVNYRDYPGSYVVPIIGDTPLQALTPVRLNLLYAHLLKNGRVRGPGGLSPKTAQNVHRMLHRALSDAVRWDFLPRNVAEDAKPPAVKRCRPRIWTPDQLRLFVDEVANDRFFALWLLVVTTGLRRGELAGLQDHDIDLVNGTVTPSRPRVAGRAQHSEPKTAKSPGNTSGPFNSAGLGRRRERGGPDAASSPSQIRPDTLGSPHREQSPAETSAPPTGGTARGADPPIAAA